jgi:NADH:ubiquinone oxidoreductase subunit E
MIMDIFVCVGSSCHLKDSKSVINKLTALIAENKLNAEVALKGSFCMGNCGTEGVSVKVDDTVYSVKCDEVEDFFKEHILNK